jgi:hypothetical protein
MIAIRGRHGKDADHRFAELPWDEHTPRWQEIDQCLPADHLARQVNEVVEELDRLHGFWDDWNEQVLHEAQALGLPVADRVAVDGTLIAALASRHRKTPNARVPSEKSRRKSW